MAPGGGKPRWGVDIGLDIGLVSDKGGRDLVVAICGKDRPVEASAGEKREVEGGVGGV